MSNPDSGALPVTGAGPATFALGVIGAICTIVGATARRIARRPAV